MISQHSKYVYAAQVHRRTEQAQNSGAQHQRLTLACPHSGDDGRRRPHHATNQVYFSVFPLVLYRDVVKDVVGMWCYEMWCENTSMCCPHLIVSVRGHWTTEVPYSEEVQFDSL
jgi:hypothetical protein